MNRRLSTTFRTAIVLGLAAAITAPVSFAQDAPRHVEIPAWLAKIQYPGTSSQPTVYMAGSIPIPAGLVRTQFPGTSSQPTVLVDVARGGSAPTVKIVNGRIQLPPRLAHLPYPGASAQPTVYVRNGSATRSTGGGFDWTSAVIGGAVTLGLAIAAAGGVLAMRKRRTLAHV